MARRNSSLIYLGIKGHVMAFDRKSGTEVWRAELPARYKSSNSIVNVFCDAEGLFASCAGEVFALDPRSGSLLWHDRLKGMGTGVAIFASPTESSGQAPAIAAADAARRAAAAAAAAT